MEQIYEVYPKNKEALYALLAEQVEAVTAEVPYLISNLSNVSALLNQAMTDINWVGFYLMNNDKLVLGPFQGKVACVEIAAGKGVCGTAVELDKVMLVPDVHAFPGHIACDDASRSEIVLPLHKEGNIVGVLDIDSPLPGRFTEEDKVGLLKVVDVLEKII